jgi:hypothetical protein
MKEIYVSPEIEIVKLDSQDIITTSSFADSGFDGEDDRSW